MPPTPVPIKSTTQEYLNIEDIKDNLVILKDGSCSLILQTTAVNFNLLSEKEQNAIIFSYAGLLNSLSFPIQIFIRSRKKDISSYLNLLKKYQDQQKSEKLKEQIKKYQKFIEKTIKENQVLDKDFYLIIPFSSFELGISKTAGSKILKREKKLPYKKEYILEKAKTSLFPKRDHLIKQFSLLGLKAIQLNTKQLIELFYNIYNSESEGQKLGTSENYNSFFIRTPQKQTLIKNKNLEKKKTLTPPSIPKEKLEGGLLQNKINQMIKEKNV